jgi:uncharacterized membrane protein
MSCQRKLAMLVLFVCFIATTSALTFAQDASANRKCTFQTLNLPVPASSTPDVVALNDAGAIVGEMSTGLHNVGFLFYRGTFTRFKFPGSVTTFPEDINDNGVIVGSFVTAEITSKPRAFMVHSGGFHEVKLPGFPNAMVIATGINDNGDITGQFNGNGSDLLGGFLLHKGHLTILSFPGAKGGTFPTGINNQGEIVGTYHLSAVDLSHGFTWKNGVFANVQFPGAVITVPVKISNAGDVVGMYVDSIPQAHGFSFDKGTYTSIDAPNSLGTEIFGVNNHDQIVGVSQTQNGNINFKAVCTQVF